MLTATKKGGNKMNRKIFSISSKRQITIPQKFYQALGFGSEAEYVVRGDELLSRFKERQAQIRPAVETLLSAAEGTGEFASYKDVFGREE